VGVGMGVCVCMCMFVCVWVCICTRVHACVRFRVVCVPRHVPQSSTWSSECSGTGCSEVPALACPTQSGKSSSRTLDGTIHRCLHRGAGRGT
jgi:hypothetical protein